jgi:hypothetical protein
MNMLPGLNDDYLLVFPELQVISVFESVHYEFYDHDGLGPSQRNYLMDKLKKVGFNQTSGKWLEHSDGRKVYFPTSKMFNRDFNNFLADQKPGKNIWLATTPTQTAYLMFKDEAYDFVDVTILMSKQPFNLDKLLHVTTHESFHSRIAENYIELVRLHERAKVLLKNKVALGSLN